MLPRTCILYVLHDIFKHALCLYWIINVMCHALHGPWFGSINNSNSITKLFKITLVEVASSYALIIYMCKDGKSRHIPVKQTRYLVMTGMITLAKPSCWWWHCSSVRVTIVKSLLTSVLTTLLWTSPWPWPEWLVTTLWVRNSIGRVSSFIKRA